jgi:endoglucanase
MSFEDRELPFDFNLLRDLTEFHGPPGYEDRVRGLVTEALEERTDEVRTDAMGNVVGTVEGESDYSVVVAAHVDEIGFMVRHVTDEGFLQLDALGGWDPRVLRAQTTTTSRTGRSTMSTSTWAGTAMSSRSW